MIAFLLALAPLIEKAAEAGFAVYDIVQKTRALVDETVPADDPRRAEMDDILRSWEDRFDAATADIKDASASG